MEKGHNAEPLFQSARAITLYPSFRSFAIGSGMNNATDWSVSATSGVFAVNQGRREYERGRVTGVESSRPPVPHLTAREREIVQLLAEGKTNKEVAVALGVSVKTVDAHRANVMHKLDLHSVTDLVRYAIRNQLIEA